MLLVTTEDKIGQGADLHVTPFPLILGKKEEVTKGKKAAEQAEQNHPHPLSSRSGYATDYITNSRFLSS